MRSFSKSRNDVSVLRNKDVGVSWILVEFFIREEFHKRLAFSCNCSRNLLLREFFGSRLINVNIKMYIFDHLRMYIFAILPLDRYIFLSDKIFL